MLVRRVLACIGAAPGLPAKVRAAYGNQTTCVDTDEARWPLRVKTALNPHLLTFEN